jgi:cellobiose transport system substrate-binding protein
MAGVLSLTAACGSSDKKSESGDSNAPVTLTVDTFGSFGYDALLKQYQALHPNVTIKTRNYAKLDDFKPKLAQYIATGSGAGDVVGLEEGILPAYTRQPDKFLDLNQYGGGALQKNFLPWKWQMGLSNDGKHLIGLGTDIGPLGMCYRTDLFKQAGLPTNRDQVSQLWPTWDALLTTAQKFQAKVPNVKFLDSPNTIFRPLLLQQAGQGNGMTYFDKSGSFIMNSNPAVKSAFDETMKFQTAKVTANYDIFSPEWIAAFQRNAFAALPCPSWMLGPIQQFAGSGGAGKWDVASIPGGGGYWGGSWLAVPKQTKHPKEAAALAEYLSSPEGQLSAYEAVNNFPSSPKYYNDPVISGKTSDYFGGAPVGKIFSAGASQVKPVYLGPKNEDVRAVIEADLRAVESGQLSATTAWSKALSDAQKAAG